MPLRTSLSGHLKQQENQSKSSMIVLLMWLARLVNYLDNLPSRPSGILICTHAATIPIIGRILTGTKLESPTEEDFIPWTASLSTFQRCCVKTADVLPDAIPGQALPKVEWEHGSGIGGRWECTVNADCKFLSHGQQRGLRFSGRESFSHAVAAHGLDAGTGLGHIIELEKVDAER